ncbi:hypothetical protein LTR08_001820 [Meristemomyces frigidus]|nr:hypothetical protein LTR08_001820 [Meristemomyces frigidus]
MRASIAAPLAIAALAAAAPQGVTSAIAPSSSAPAGCMADYSGNFAIQVVNVTSSAKRSVEKRADDSTLIMTLAGGILTDSKGRTGYIAANSQFQFDAPAQTGAIYTAGWSVCGNGSLAIGSDATFYQCLSGTFYNLYDESTGAQCSQVYIDVISSGSSSGAASQSADGQVTAAAGANPVTQISDGQPQATTATGRPVSQLSDGQPQASISAAPVTQIGDGQPQAPATTAAAVSQIGDGQPQAPVTTAAPVTQISDGQPQAPVATSVAPVSQISDGQTQAPTGANSTIVSPTASVVPYTGAAMPIAVRGELFGLAAGVLALAML